MALGPIARRALLLSTYGAVKVLGAERPQWIDVVRTCYEISADYEEFAGAWVVSKLGRWIPSLRMLNSYGILEKIDTSRGGKRAYYRMCNREEVGRALAEF